LENSYNPEEILILKKMMDEDGHGCNFKAYCSLYDKDNFEKLINGELEESDNPLLVVNCFSSDKEFSVDVYKEPEYYLKYIVISYIYVAISNSGDGTVFAPAFKDCVNWHEYLDAYHFVFYLKKEEIPLYINKKGLEVFFKWRLKIGK